MKITVIIEDKGFRVEGSKEARASKTIAANYGGMLAGELAEYVLNYNRKRGAK